MWDEEDGFFYDVLRLPDGRAQRLKVRSMVGLLPLCAATVFDGELLAKYPELAERFQWFLDARPELYAAIHDPTKTGVAGRRLGFDPGRNQAPPRAGEDARRERVPQPVRHPLAVALPRRASLCHPRRRPGISCRPICRPSPTPACSAATRTGAGPIWMPVNALIIRALLQYYLYYGDDFTVECPTGSGRQMNLYQVAEEIARRLGEHLPEGQGRPPPGLRRARRSSRRTRTGAIASCSTSTSTATTGPASAPATRPAGPGSSPGLMHLFATLTPEQALAGGKKAYFELETQTELAGSPAGR